MQPDAFQFAQQPGGASPSPQSGFGAPPQFPSPAGPSAAPQFAPPQPGYSAPPQGYPAQPGFNGPPPGFSGPPQPGYGVPPQGYPSQPGFPGGPGGRAPKKGKGGLIAVIAIVVVVVIIGGAAAAFALNGKKSPGSASRSQNSASSQTANTPGVTVTPTPTTPPSSGNAPAGFKQYSGSLFSINYPEDWTLEPSTQANGTTSFTGSQGQIFQVDVENSGDEDINQLLTLYCQTLSDTAGSPTTITIGGQQWQQRVCESNGQPAAAIEAVTYKGHIFSISYFSLAGTYATDATQYYQPMEQSFVFLS